MKQFYILVALAFVFPYLSPAQYLADNSTSQRDVLAPGSPREVPAFRSLWEKEQDLVNGHISNSKLSKMKTIAEAVVAFFHDSCISDEQANPLWHGEYFSEKASSAPQTKFGVFLNFYEQKAHLSIIANDISPLLDHLTVNNRDFGTIPPPTTVKNDCPYFEFTSSNAGGNGTGSEGGNGTGSEGAEATKPHRSRVWLVTTGNNHPTGSNYTAGNTPLPYTPVTRKEYLQEARLELINIKNGIIADWKQKTTVRPAAIQESEKKATLEQLSATYSGMDLQVRTKMYLNNYQTDEEYLKAGTDKATADLDSTLHLMDHLLAHMRAEELNKPAIVSAQAAGFQGFEDGLSGKMLIRMNPTYFNPYLSGEKPQLFLVRWSYDPSEPMAEGIDRQIQERFDCQQLKEMLGK